MNKKSMSSHKRISQLMVILSRWNIAVMGGKLMKQAYSKYK